MKSYQFYPNVWVRLVTGLGVLYLSTIPVKPFWCE